MWLLAVPRFSCLTIIKVSIMVDINNYREIVKGEIEILREEIEKFNQQHYSAKLNASDFLECVTPHLDSIGRKTGRNSIEYIN